MTTEEKQILLKDLCARLPYGVKVQCITKSARIANASPLIETLNTVLYKYVEEDNIELKPYLRPISSMTEEEENELTSIAVLGGYNNSVFNSFVVVDWLNTHHFDYRRLIEKGLVLEAPKGMYKIK